MSRYFLVYFLICLLPFYVFSQTKEQLDPVRIQVSPKEFEAKLKASREIVLLDVRTPQEFASGYIEGAKNLNFYDKDFSKKLSKIDRSRPVFLYCKAGGRSAEAMSILEGLGFQHLVNLEGGIMSWDRAGLPKINPSEKILTEEYSLADYHRMIQSEGKILVDFYAPWCKPCMRMKPSIEKLALNYPQKLKVLKLDYDKNPTIAKEEEIIALPTILVYKNGKKTYHQVKELNYSELEALIR